MLFFDLWFFMLLLVSGLDICGLYGVDAQEVVETWMAFSVSNNHHEVTLEALGQMERKEFAKRAAREVPTPKGPSKQNAKSSVVVYNASKDPVMYPLNALNFNFP